MSYENLEVILVLLAVAAVIVGLAFAVTELARKRYAVLASIAAFLVAIGLMVVNIVAGERAENATYEAIENIYGHLDERGTLGEADSAWVIDGVRYRCDATDAKPGDTTPVLACVRDAKQPLATS